MFSLKAVDRWALEPDSNGSVSERTIPALPVPFTGFAKDLVAKDPNRVGVCRLVVVVGEGKRVGGKRLVDFDFGSGRVLNVRLFGSHVFGSSGRCL